VHFLSSFFRSLRVIVEKEGNACAATDPLHKKKRPMRRTGRKEEGQCNCSFKILFQYCSAVVVFSLSSIIGSQIGVGISIYLKVVWR